MQKTFSYRTRFSYFLMLHRTNWSAAPADLFLSLQMGRKQRGTWSHSSPATGCVGLGNQPERLATSLAAPMLPWMSLMDDAEIWESGSNPDNMPCSSEHGASKQNNTEAEVFFFE